MFSMFDETYLKHKLVCLTIFSMLCMNNLCSLLLYKHSPEGVLHKRCYESSTKFIISDRIMPFLCQASSEQAEAQSRLKKSRQMLPILYHAWTCLSIVTLECTSSAKRFLPKTVNEKKFLSTQSLTFILTKIQSDYNMGL